MTSAAFHPFLPLVATGNADGTVWIWQFTGSRVELVQQLDAYLGQVYSVRYSPDGTRLLTAGCDANGSSNLVDSAGNSLCVQSSAILWDQAGSLLATLRQQRWTSLAEFSPAGDQTADGRLRPAARSAQDSERLHRRRRLAVGAGQFPAEHGRTRPRQPARIQRRRATSCWP